MAATDSRPVPIKNTAYRVIFPILDADGDLVTGAAGLDSEVSKDCATFADCTNEATEIATSSGIYYLDLTSTEMNADSVAVIVKTSTTGAKTTTVVMYPQESGDIKVDVQSVAGTAQTAGDIIGDTNDIQARLPAALVSGRMDASVGAMAANVLTATAIAADAITDAKVASDVTIASVTGAVGSVTGAVGSVTGAVGSVTGAVGSVTGNVGGNVTGSVGSVTGLTNATIADAVWDEAQAGHVTAGSFGEVATEVAAILVDTAEIGAAGAGLTALATQASVNTIDGIVDSILVDTAEIGAAGAGLTVLATAANLATVAGYLDTEIAAVLADTNELQTDWVNGGRLDLLIDAIKAKTDALPAAPAATGDIPSAASIADAVWDEALSGHAGAGSAGEALSAAGTAGDPWTTSLPGAYGAGTAGNIIGNNLNATVSSRASQASLDTVDGIVDSILVDTAEIGAAGAGLTNINLPNQTMDIVGNITGNLSGSVGSVAANGLSASSLAADAVAEIADGVWDEALAGHAGAGSAGEALSAAGTAGDPWTTSLPGAYGAGTAGFILGTNLDVAASTLATAANLATAAGYIDTEVAAIKAKTDNLPASPAAVGSAMTLTSAYDFAKGDVAVAEAYATDGAEFTPAQALYMIWGLLAEKNIAGTTMTIKKLDGSTSAMTFTLNDATTPTAITRAT